MLKYINRISLFCILACCLLGAESVEPAASLRPGKDHALFFAVNSYDDPGWTDLRNPIRDAEAVAKELREVYGFQTQIIPNADKKKILQTLVSWQKKRFASDGQLLVFFSGHGAFSETLTQGYFVPKNGKAEDDFNESQIALTTLGNAVTKIRCPHILLAIDACYSGTIDQEIAFKGRTFSRPGAGSQDTRQPIIDLQLRNPTRLLLTSGGKERTPDGSQHSPFADAFLKALRAGYTSGDGLVLFQDILAKMERVRPVPHSGELPGHEEGGFVFVSQLSPKPRPAAGVTLPSKPIDQIPRPKMIRISGGTFQMGSNEGHDEKPIHQVTVSDFELGETEVTVAEFKAFVDAANYRTDAEKEGDSRVFADGEWKDMKGVNWRHDEVGKIREAAAYTHPVIHVSWNDAQAYCKWLSKQGLGVYRLPTEAEWEYAAGNGTKHTRYSWGNENPSGKKGGNVTDETRSPDNRTWTKKFEGYNDGYWYSAPVGTYLPNEFELLDMTGNVWEWCGDWYGKDYYASSPSRNPKGPDSGAGRVIRGGGWGYDPGYCRVAGRLTAGPTYRSYGVGFRVARQF